VGNTFVNTKAFCSEVEKKKGRELVRKVEGKKKQRETCDESSKQGKGGEWGWGDREVGGMETAKRPRPKGKKSENLKRARVPG